MLAKQILYFCVILTLVCTYQTGVYSQSTNREAIELFNRATSEPDPEVKIELYTQAIAQDSDFVEAYYNLGLAYKQIRDFRSAENYLQKAREVSTSATSNELRTRILYHLSTTQKRLEKLSQSESSLRAAMQIANDERMLSKIMFELGLVLYEQKKYDQALAQLRTGQERFNDSRSYFENMINIVRTEIEVQGLDNDLQAALAAGDILEAQALVQQLKKLKPNHEGLDKKIALIDSLLNSKAKREFLTEMYQLAGKQTREGNLEKAINTYEILLQHDPNYEDAQSKLEQMRDQYTELQTAQQIEAEFATGMTALQEQNWTRAIIAFERVLELAPEHPEANGRLREANRGLENESTETIVRQYYLDGVSAMDNKDLASALASFEKVVSFNPNYRDAKDLIQQIKRSYKPGIASAMPSDEYFNSLYDQAVTMMKEEEWMQAVLVLEKLRLLAPNDHNILNLLIQAKENSRLNQDTVEAAPAPTQNRLIYIAGAVVLLVILPLFSFIVFSPSSRARIYYLRGNYVKAARIYEKLLARHPERLKYYPTLANIYLMLGRNDERALKVYRMLIDLNLAKQIHPQISAILSQKYLNEGKTEDEEAIAILENELKAVQENQNNAES